MFVRKKHRLRHNLLGLLLDKFELNVEQNARHKVTVRAEEVSIPIQDVADKLGITVDELKSITPPLIRAEEINVDDFGEGISIFAWQDSQTAYDEKKYLEIGRKKFNDDVYDVVKWLLPIILILLSITTTYVNLQLNRDRAKMQEQIDQIKLELNRLKR